MSAIPTTLLPELETTIRVTVIENTRFAAQLLCDALKRERQFDVRMGLNSKIADITSDIEIALVSANLQDQAFKGCDFTRELLAKKPDLRVIMLIEQSTREIVLQAFRSGARGVFGRNDDIHLLRKCIQSVHSGQIWANGSEIQYLLEAASRPIPVRVVDANGTLLLSPREQDVVHLVLEGFTNRDIADRLGLSEHTIKNYLFRIFEKLGVSNRIELVLYVRNQLERRAAISDLQRVHISELLTPAWCRKMARHFGRAAYRLGEMHRDGIGVPVAIEESLMWFNIAEIVSAETTSNSRVAQEQIKKHLTREQIVGAQARALEWLTSQSAKP